MSILIKTVRISGFRGLKNIEVELEETTVLTGMNNTGKTSFLKALQLVFSSYQSISKEDFFIQENAVAEKIIVDILIVPTERNFSENWEILFTTGRIRGGGVDDIFVPIRTIVTFDPIKNDYKIQKFVLQSWPEFKNEQRDWFNVDNGKKSIFYFDEIPFFYMGAQRDILEDTKLRNSYLGRMLSKIEYSKEDIKSMEEQIESLNEKAVNSSDILSNIKKNLEELDSALDRDSKGIEITPFTKKIRDLNKGLTIYYTDNLDSFSMEYHGMGTRSWSSLLTLKAFIHLLSRNAEKEEAVFFPLLAIEEPEAHLHPNAQKKLYGQIDAIPGQKIISTHSPYIATSAKLKQIRSFYKGKTIICGQIKIDNSEETRKINRQVVNTRGEIFFSRAIVLLEGESEEQALPLFYKKHFKKSPAEMGVNFIGVGGHGNYSLFIRFSESLKIPWFIFSDGEPSVVKSVRSQINNSSTDKTKNDNIVFLEEGKDFEKQLIEDGFSGEIKTAIIASEDFENEQYKQSKSQEIKNYSSDELYKNLKNNKTKYAPVIAEQIIQSEKQLPLNIVALFEKIAVILKIEVSET